MTTKQMDLSELSVRQPKTEQMRTVEASLRLDAVTSAGFRISRGKAADLIKHGDVRFVPLKQLIQVHKVHGSLLH